jgi:elongation factor G
LGVNQLEHEKANWETCLDELRQCFGNKVVVVQFPVATGAEFNAFIDVLKMKMYRFKDDSGVREELEIPADFKDQADELHAALCEHAAENDEALMEIFFDKGNLSLDELHKGLSIGLKNGGLMPLFCLSGKKDIGVKRLMEFIIHAGPSPETTEQLTVDGTAVPCTATG